MRTPMLEKLKIRARALKNESFAVYLAAKDPRTPWFAKAAAFCVLAYALSPIDLIPDFIPVLGYLDDLLLVPAGIALVIRLIPPRVLAEARKTVADQGPGRSVGYIGAGMIVAVWIILCIAVVNLMKILSK